MAAAKAPTKPPAQKTQAAAKAAANTKAPTPKSSVNEGARGAKTAKPSSSSPAPRGNVDQGPSAQLQSALSALGKLSGQATGSRLAQSATSSPGQPNMALAALQKMGQGGGGSSAPGVNYQSQTQGYAMPNPQSALQSLLQGLGGGGASGGSAMSTGPQVDAEGMARRGAQLSAQLQMDAMRQQAALKGGLDNQANAARMDMAKLQDSGATNRLNAQLQAQRDLNNQREGGLTGRLNMQLDAQRGMQTEREAGTTNRLNIQVGAQKDMQTQREAGAKERLGMQLTANKDMQQQQTDNTEYLRQQAAARAISNFMKFR